MKRNTPLTRKAPMERRTPLEPGPPPKRKSWMRRSNKRMKQRSDKRQEHLDAIRPEDEQWRREHPECVFCFYRHGKRKSAGHKHHIVPRSKVGGLRWDLPANWSPTCAHCHNEMDDPHLWSYAEQLAAVWVWHQERGVRLGFDTLLAFLTAWRKVDAQQCKGVAIGAVKRFIAEFYDRIGEGVA